MSQLGFEHYNIEKFFWNKSDLISHFKTKNKLRRKNGVLEYSIFKYLNKEDYYVTIFRFPNFQACRKHIENVLETYPEVNEMMKAQDYVEYNVNKKQTVELENDRSEFYSILRIYVQDYKQFEKNILSNFPQIIKDYILGYNMFTNHYNENIVLLILNWIDESSFNEYIKSYEIQSQVKLNLSVDDLDNDPLMREIYYWNSEME
ncbi:MAG: hypothetical protein GPJ54_01360 [Candidatus Heimdallarchaeota archaeon]|nr:hypothetical protein [Candidatus Heimdallarchaeota archaeon]